VAIGDNPAMQIKLYVFPGGDGVPSVSPPCVRVQLALARSGVPHETVYLRSWTAAAKVSPTGRLPAVAIDGAQLSDSVEILDELERRFPSLGLTPAEPVARLRDRLWEHYVNDHIYWLGYYMRWVDPDNHRRFLGALLARAPLLTRVFGPAMMRRYTRNRSQQVGIRGKRREEVLRAYERALDMFQTGLFDGPYLERRDVPARGDLAVASTVAQIGFRGTMPEMEERARKRPAVLDHTRRVFEACKTKLPRWLER
jgi:glutathione S-transferase